MVRTERYKYVHRLYEEDELYDLHSDPGELTNIIRKPACQEIIQTLKERLIRFFMETGDVVPRKPDPR